MNNKVLTKIAELNLQNERSKQDLDKQFPKEQQKGIFVYELVKFDDPEKTFVANTTDGTINVSGFKLIQETTLYIESEFKSLFTESGAQLTISDNRNIYGYLKDDLDYDNKSYFITSEVFNAGDPLNNVYMIDNNNQYDEINMPEIERVQLKPMASELSFSNSAKWVLVDSIENPAGLSRRTRVDSVNVTFKNPEIALSAIDIFNGEKAYTGTSTDNYVPFPVIPTSVVGNSVNAYSPHLDSYANVGLLIRYLPIFKPTDMKYTALQLQNHLGPLHELFLNVLSICHMVQIGFAGVKEEGFAPGSPSVAITPSAGWYWKEKLEDKEPKAIAAEIQNLIDLNMQASLSGQIYKDIDSNNVHGNIGSSTIPSSNPRIYQDVELDNTHWQAFFSLLGAMYPQIFSNYTIGYGGGFEGDAIFPFKISADNSKFIKGKSYDMSHGGDDGSEMLKYEIDADLTITSNYSTPISQAKTIDTYSGGSTTTIFYYEGTFTTRKAGQVYVIDKKYAEQIDSSSITTSLRNAQNRMITSPGAVSIGTPNQWTFVNNAPWTNNVAGAFEIPQSVFENMEDPVFYYALTEDEINDYYNEGESFTDYRQAQYEGGYGQKSFERGYPRVPNAINIITTLKADPNAVVEYFIAANSSMRDDNGGNNDYKLVLQDPDITVRDLAVSGSKIDSKIQTDVTTKEVIDGWVPYQRPEANLVATSVGKSSGVNTDAIFNAPKVFIKGTDIIETYDQLDNVPYSSLSDMIFRMTKGVNQDYTMEIPPISAGESVSSVGLSTLGAGTFSVNITYTTDTGGQTNIIIDSHSAETNIYSNNLFIDSDESWINTYTLINFGEE